MYHALKEFADSQNMITKDKLCLVLRDYGLFLREEEFESFCAR